MVEISLMQNTLTRLTLRLILILLAMSLLTISIPLATVYAQNNTNTATVVPTALTVREGPGINFPSLDIIPKNAEFVVEGRENLPDNGLWVYGVTEAGLYGWVLSDFLTFPTDFVMLDLPVLGIEAPTGVISDTGADADTESETETNTDTQSATSFGRSPIITATTIAITEVYAGLGNQSEILNTLEPDTQVRVLGRDKSHFWIQVQTSSYWQNAWVFYGNLDLSDGTRDLPVVQLEENTADVQEDEAESDATPDTPAPIAGDMVTLAFANLRTGPSLNYGIIFLAEPNTALNATGRTAESDWLAVEINGQTGWLYRPLVNISATAVAGLPVVDAPALPASGIDSSAVHYYAVAMNSSPAAQGDNDLDGRLNPYMYLASGLIFCFDGEGYTDRGTFGGGGILVFLFYGDPQGVVFVAQESQILAVGVPDQPTLIHADSGFFLYRMPDGAFQMDGPNTDGSRFSVQWHNCGPNPITQ